ncbi:hypothetical protein HU200_021948 [Digitaria exilis]|uniref:Uncharacterized protein n=1 Tax=Digitaria exilis TaxID=1010633 RepID=A0A835C5E2_9POAL|nr:hypothetical protein HU200_021948 [Digitaria exilis]
MQHFPYADQRDLTHQICDLMTSPPQQHHGPPPRKRQTTTLEKPLLERNRGADPDPGRRAPGSWRIDRPEEQLGEADTERRNPNPQQRVAGNTQTAVCGRERSRGVATFRAIPARKARQNYVSSPHGRGLPASRGRLLSLRPAPVRPDDGRSAIQRPFAPPPPLFIPFYKQRSSLQGRRGFRCRPLNRSWPLPVVLPTPMASQRRLVSHSPLSSSSSWRPGNPKSGWGPASSVSSQQRVPSSAPPPTQPRFPPPHDLVVAVATWVTLFPRCAQQLLQIGCRDVASSCESTATGTRLRPLRGSWGPYPLDGAEAQRVSYVMEARVLDLPKGSDKRRFGGVATQIDPASEQTRSELAIAAPRLLRLSTCECMVDLAKKTNP